MANVKGYVRSAFYYETDNMGIIHHSNYIRWFEEARLHFLDEIKIPYDKIEESGIMIPVLSVTANYHESIKYKDEIRIDVEISVFNGVRLEIEYKVYNTKTNRLCCSGVSKHCFVDNNFKVLNLRKVDQNLYNTFLNNTRK